MFEKRAVEHFDQRAAEWERLYTKPQFLDRRNLFVGMVKQSSRFGGVVLDYGCGTGAISRALAEEGFQVDGIDPSDEMIRHASSYSVNPTNPIFECVDPNGWQARRRYDSVVCSSVIEYVEDDIALLRKLSEALSDGGHLFISVPSRESWVGKVEDLLKFATVRDSRFAHRRYSEEEVQSKIESCGLTWMKSLSFELPIFGKWGVRLSRIRRVGLMRLVVAVKAPS